MNRFLSRFLAALCTALACSTAMANSLSMPADMPKAFSTECTSCHVPYSPGLMPATSWHKIMGSLDQHFGADASMDAKSAAEIGVWLEKHAATSRRFAEAPPGNRISDSQWFTRQHHELNKAVWSRPAVKSRSNCSACHQQAAKGDFDEDHVRVPR